MITNTVTRTHITPGPRQYASKPDSGRGFNSSTARSAPTASTPATSAEPSPDIQQLNDDIKNLEKWGGQEHRA